MEIEYKLNSENMPDKIVIYDFLDGCEEYWYHLTDKRGVIVPFKINELTAKKEVHKWFQKAVELGLNDVRREVSKHPSGCRVITFFEPIKE